MWALSKRKKSESDDDKTEVPDEFDDDFFERCQNGESRQLLLKVASLQECTMIQSLLASNGVPSHREHEHFNSLYGSGMSNLLTATFSIQLWILSSDYDMAFEIARDYMSQKCNDLKNRSSTSKGHKLVEKTLSILFAPYPISKSYQLLGITIFPKKPVD